MGIWDWLTVAPGKLWLQWLSLLSGVVIGGVTGMCVVLHDILELLLADVSSFEIHRLSSNPESWKFKDVLVHCCSWSRQPFSSGEVLSTSSTCTNDGLLLGSTCARCGWIKCVVWCRSSITNGSYQMLLGNIVLHSQWLEGSCKQ